ncbi:MAG: DUF2441 domain-containing protein [Bacteroidales bacterium]|nr:DUF2441 domain-containing protein [Bacteroidales bacterium]
MTKIQNKEFYHIQKLDFINKEWNVNNHYHIGSENNNFYRKLLNSLGSREFYDIPKVFLIRQLTDVLKLKPNKDERDYEKLFFESEQHLFQLEAIVDDVMVSFKQYLKWIQEEIFEKVRLEKFPDLPSRQKCLWICSLDDLPKWLKIFKGSENKILKIRVTGKIHKTDGLLIDSDTYFINEFEKRAIDYWTGKIEHKDEIEFLFHGDLEVLNVYDSVNEIKN